MLSSGDYVKKILTLVETGYFHQAAVHIAEDFRFSGPVPDPLDKRGFIEFMQGLMAAFPDWKFRVRDIREEGAVQRMKLHIKGTNTGKIDIPALGLRDIPPTGRHVELPGEPCEARLEEGKLASLKFESVPGGGFRELFAQLGIGLPSPVGA